MPQIVINIDNSGDVTVEAKQIAGGGCQALTAAIEAAVGRTTVDVRKPEYHQPQAAHERANARAGH